MPLPASVPSEDASFGSIDFLELHPDGRYASVERDEERTTIGQTVVLRYTKPIEVQVQALCGLDEADDFEAAIGDSATLAWHRGSESATLLRCSIVRIQAYAIAEATLTFGL
jgi:hypothetical protein